MANADIMAQVPRDGGSAAAAQAEAATHAGRRRVIAMKKSFVLVGMMLAASLYASDARAQHKTPNHQPPQEKDVTGPAGELALGAVRLPKGLTADGKPLPPGTYQVRLTTPEAGTAAA